MSDQDDDTSNERREHSTGGLDPAPVESTEEKSDPEAGTASADKRSPENKGANPDAGETGGNQT